MRKLLLPGIVLAALFVACENKGPVGPDGVGPGGGGPGGVTVTQTTTSTTTTTSTPTTTTTTSTTTTVTGSLSRQYVAFQPPPDVPANMTLFFQLLTAPTLLSSLAERLPFFGTGPSRITENLYEVTGVFVMLNGITGTVEGELGGALNPLETGGQFEGSLRARVGSCTARRDFEGPLGPQTLAWTGGRTFQDCPGSPLSFSSFTMLRGDAPLPTTTVPTSTTTSVPTTTSTSTSSSTSTTTTTTAVVCNYSLSPTSASVTAAGGTGQVVIGTQPTCPWTAQSFATWLTVTPASGAGPAAVTFTAAANTNGPARTGTLVIAGATFTVTQDAPVPPDLLVPATDSATTPISCGAGTVTVLVRNAGNGPATVTSVARILFLATKTTADQTTPTIAAGAQVPVTFTLPAGCFQDGVCGFGVTVDATNVVFESDETNNVLSLGRCSASVPALRINR